MILMNFFLGLLFQARTCKGDGSFLNNPVGNVPMNAIAKILTIPFLFLFSSALFAENEPEGIFEDFEGVGEDLRSEMDELKEEVEYLQKELVNARREADTSMIHHMELELIRASKDVAKWQSILERYEKLLDEEGDDLELKVPAFMRSIGDIHRGRDLSRVQSEISGLEFELRLARQSDDEDRVRNLQLRLEHSRANLASRNQLGELAEKLELARLDDRHEDADQMQRRLFVAEKDLVLEGELQELEFRRKETKHELDHINLEMFRAKAQVELADSTTRQLEHLAKEWQRLRKVLSSTDVGEEEFDQAMESAKNNRVRFNLRREIMEANFELSIAEKNGESEDVGEILRHLRELEEAVLEQR